MPENPALRRGWLIVAGLAAAALLANRLLLREEASPTLAATAEAEVVARAAAGDSGRAGEALLDLCSSAADVTGCYERVLLAVTRKAGPRPAMGTLSRLGARDPGARREGHVLSHAVGIEAYRAAPQVGRTFAECTEIFQSGCYHGVIQAYFEDVPTVGAAEVNAVCREYTQPDTDWWLRFQCVHGMGHGLTMFHRHHVPRALAGCDLLEDGWDRDACYGGVFMENIVNATNPHHPAAGLQAATASSEGVEVAAGDEHGGADAEPAAAHAHGAASDEPAPAAGEPPFKALDPEDPHYPCSAVEPRYLVACYQMQTSVMLHWNGGDIADAARSCDGAPNGLRASCYQSLGRDVSSYTAQDHAEAIRLCSLGTTRWQPWCFVGVVKNFVDLTARAEDGLAFCRNVPEGPNRILCYVAVGEEIAVLENEREGRDRLCAGAGGDPWLQACRYGARTLGIPPEGMPAPS